MKFSLGTKVIVDDHFAGTVARGARQGDLAHVVVRLEGSNEIIRVHYSFLELAA